MGEYGEWTREPPTKEGWYWVRTPLWPQPCIFRVACLEGVWRIFVSGFIYKIADWQTPNVEFYSTPIAEPEEAK